MTPECQNCGHDVTERYNRVFSPDEAAGPRVCPHCPDKLREGREIRDAKSPRGNPSDPAQYDPGYGAEAGGGA